MPESSGQTGKRELTSVGGEIAPGNSWICGPQPGRILPSGDFGHYLETFSVAKAEVGNVTII